MLHQRSLRQIRDPRTSLLLVPLLDDANPAVATEAMRFLRPVAIGDEVSCYCSLETTGETSVVVKVETWARGRGRGRRPEKVTEGVFTFVAIDDEGHPRPLPEEAAEA